MRGLALNYHHLYYFWVVAREGSLTAACRRLGLAPSTVSAQLKELEAHFEHDLFDRRGRSLVLTDEGKVALEYAEQIFTLGSQLDDAMLRGRAGRPQRLRVGVSSLMPKLVAHLLLDATMDEDDLQLHVYGDRPDRLVADLNLHDLDLILVDEPVRLSGDRDLKTHVLGTTGLTVFGTWSLARGVLEGFPDSLDGAPMLLPVPGTHSRRDLEHLLSERGITPQVVAEFADSGLLKAFGGAGHGLFAAPSVVSDAICATYDVVPVGELPDIEEEYRALVPARSEGHPAVQVVLRHAATAWEREPRSATSA